MNRFLVGGCVAVLCVVAALQAHGQENALDPAKAVAGADGKSQWYNALDIGLEGQGWTTLKHPYDRMPAEAEGVVPDPVWRLSQNSAGLSVRFVTNSPEVWARWSLRSDRLDMVHMPATGVSGVDLYAKQNGRWGWVGTGRPEKQQGNESKLVSGMPEGPHEYLLYLPLYNGTDSLEIGVNTGSTLSKAPHRAKPVLVWGTSIVHGGCASRPGMAYPAILGRRFDRPFINLGFSGNGRMDPEVTPLIAKLDVAAYVIDCAPNMKPEEITERTEPLVKALREAKPDTPIVLVENVQYQSGWIVPGSRESYENKNAALKAAYERLVGGGVAKLHYVTSDKLLGSDGEATVDGTHPTDLGFLRMADGIEPALREALK